MPRPCAVYGCENDEENRICHRFPKDRQMAILWKNELKLKDFSVEMLQKNFTVCNKHFSDADFKHIHELKPTAIPKLKLKNGNDNVINSNIANLSSSDNSDSIEIVAPTKQNLALLQATLAAMDDEENQLQQKQPINRFKKENEIEESVASTKNSEDIFVLEMHESHFGHSKSNVEDYTSIGSPDFIILNTPNTNANKSDHPGNVQTTSSAADSDVEILQTDEHNSNPVMSMSKSVKEITAAIALASLDTNYEPKISNKAINSPTSSDDELKLPSLEPLGDFPDFFHDQEISVEELSNHTTTCSSANFYPITNDFDELERQELLKVIHEQAAYIEKLDIVLQRYRTTHKVLTGHVDAMHDELNNINTIEQNLQIINSSLKTNNTQ